MHVAGFRSIASSGVYLSFLDGDAIFVFGRNNAGKTSILKAYEFFWNAKSKPQRSDFYNFMLGDALDIEIELIFSVEDGEDRQKLVDGNLEKWISPDGFVRIKKVWSEVGGQGVKYTYEPRTDAFVKGGFGGFDTLVSHYAPTPVYIPPVATEDDLKKIVGDILKKHIAQKLRDECGEILDRADAAFRELEDAVSVMDETAKVNTLANEYFQKIFPDHALKISSANAGDGRLETLLSKSFDVTVVNERLAEEQQPLSSQGDGVVRQAIFNFIGIVKNRELIEGFANAGDRKGFLILFEEPEVYLHPSKMRLMREKLYSIVTNSPFQLLCASHSPQLIDLSKKHTSLVRIIKNEEITEYYQAGTQLFTPDDDAKDFMRMLMNFDPHICEVFFADNVILVEGDTEAIVLRSLLEESDEHREVFVLNTGSKNNIPFFQMVLTHFGIKHTVIHDADLRYQYKNGQVVTKDDGQPRTNSAWTLNARIWEQVVQSNSQKEGLSRRYVHVVDFESAHGYSYDPSEGKPFSAFKFGKMLGKDDEQPVVQFTRDMLRDVSALPEANQEWLETIVDEQHWAKLKGLLS